MLLISPASPHVSESLSQYQPGTIFLFGGTNWVSRLIQAWTCSRYSHVAIVADIQAVDVRAHRPVRVWRPSYDIGAGWQDGPYLVESTTLESGPCEILRRPINGVQVRRINQRIEDFPGKIWAMRPRHALDECESMLLTQWLLDHVGRPYDYEGAGIGGLRWLDRWLPCSHSRSRMFCSELVGGAIAYALQGRQLPEIDPGCLTPSDLANTLAKFGLYLPPEVVT